MLVGSQPWRCGLSYWCRLRAGGQVFLYDRGGRPGEIWRLQKRTRLQTGRLSNLSRNPLCAHMRTVPLTIRHRPS